MRILYEWWNEQPSRMRCLVWAVATAAFVFVLYLVMVRPASGQREALAQRRVQTASTLAGLWQRAAQNQRERQEIDAFVARPFSPLDFQLNGTRLVRWLPQGKGGVITLEADWQRLPEVFGQLAQGGMNVSMFAVEPGKSRLQLTAQMENSDAN